MLLRIHARDFGQHISSTGSLIKHRNGISQLKYDLNKYFKLNLYSQLTVCNCRRKSQNRKNIQADHSHVNLIMLDACWPEISMSTLI